MGICIHEISSFICTILSLQMHCENNFKLTSKVLAVELSEFPFGVMRGSRKFCQRGPNSSGNVFIILFIYLMRGDRIQMPVKASHHRPANETLVGW